MGNGLLDSDIRSGRENLVATYVGLARAVSASHISQSEFFTLVTGPQEYSFCNFAAGFARVSDLEMERLVELARHRSGFWIFCADGDEPSDLAATLQNRGFVLRQNLLQMVRSPRESMRDPRIIEAIDAGERIKVCQFATSIFFKRTRKAERNKISAITARSEHRLFGLYDDGQLEGALMLSESASAIGLYNLCVNEHSRNEGFGRQLVNLASQIAFESEKCLVLQCEPGLVRYYEGFDFRVFGRIRAYTFPNYSQRDIL